MSCCTEADDEQLDDSISCSSSDLSNSTFHSISPTLSDFLISEFNTVPKNFNVVHINAQSIPAHYADLLASFDSKNIHAILVSESFLHPNLPSTSYSLPGFQLIRNDRSSSCHGGVAIYLRSYIPFTVISKSLQPPLPNTAEHLFLEVFLSHTKVLLGVFYSPSLKINYFSSFEALLEELVPSYNHSIIMGDFNTCLIKNDSRARTLQSIVTSCNLHLLPLNATHFFPNCTPSLLDLMIVASPDHVARHGQVEADAFSYHNLVYLSYRIRPPKLKHRTLIQRNFKDMDLSRLCEDAENVNWSVIDSCATIDDKVFSFHKLLIELYDRHAPERPVRVKHFPAPWLTEDIKLLMEKKTRAKSRFRVDPSDRNRDRYHAIRNRCNMVIRDAQRRHIHKSVENGDPAKVWRFLSKLGVGKSRTDATSKDVDLNSLNQHFSTSTSLDAGIKLSTLRTLSSKSTPNYSPFTFRQLTDREVKSSILSISSNAVGCDSISRNMIIPLIDILNPVITKILNSSISTGIFPKAWKEAQIVPIPKKRSPASFSDYRPISILPFLSKVLEKLVHRQLSAFLNTNNLLNPLQSGFRPGHSTTTALVKISDDIRMGMENQKLTVLTLLDFSNAFNTVDFDILLGLLESINISPLAIDWFRNYLFGRRQRIRVEESFSLWCNTSAGVPQGGVLSPLLFALFINSIARFIQSSYHLYADDLQIYTHAGIDDLGNAVADINRDLARISDWSRSYGLNINPKKTQVIVIGSNWFVSRINHESLPAIVFDGVVIPYSQIVKNLGVMFDMTLSWKPQVAEVSRKIFAAYWSLKRLRNFLPTSTKITLAQSLLLPILDYADVALSDLTEELLNKLERLQNLCIRFIFGLRKFDHISAYRAKLGWLPIRRRRDCHILSLLYSVLFSPSAPPYLKEKFQLQSAIHTLPLRSSLDLTLSFPIHSTNFYTNSFTIKAVRLWNSLPPALRQVPSLDSFKKNVKAHFISLSN